MNQKHLSCNIPLERNAQVGPVAGGVVGLVLLFILGLVAAASTGCASKPDYRRVFGMDTKETEILITAAFERWRAGTGGPFELLADDVEWTIVGSSPYSRTYRSKREFMDEVINPFNARLSSPLVPTVDRINAGPGMVIVEFHGEAMARDGIAYRNSYVWFLVLRDGKIVSSVANFDTTLFDEFWQRVTPAS